MARCVEELVSRAAKLGVKITKAQADEIFSKIEGMAKQDPAMLSSVGAPKSEQLRQNLEQTSPVGRVKLLAMKAFEEKLAEKQEQIKRTQLQTASDFTRQSTYDAEGPQIGYVKSLMRMVERVESRMGSIRQEKVTEMWRALDEYRSFFSFAIRHEDMKNVARELYAIGEGKPSVTGDSKARNLAEKFSKVAEDMRVMLNNAGADIGKLTDWIAPQSWDSLRVRFAGLSEIEQKKMIGLIPASKAEKDALRLRARDTWVADMTGRIDETRYYHDDGTRYSPDEIRSMLEKSHETIVTGGMNKIEEGAAMGSGSRAKSISKSRELFLKDADSYYDMMNKYSHGDLFQTIIGHVERQAKNIALIDTFGPNTKAAFDNDLQMAQSKDGSSKGAGQVKNYFDMIYGAKDVSSSDFQTWFAQQNRNLRQFMASTRLGGMLLSQVSDMNTFGAIAHTNGFGTGDTIAAIGRIFKPTSAADRAAALDAGFFIDSFIANAQARVGEATQGTHWTSIAANATIKLNGGQWWTDSAKMEAQTLAAYYINKMRGNDFASLEGGFKKMLERYDIGAKEWDVIRSAAELDIMGRKVIAPESVKALGNREAYLSYMDLMIGEANTMVVSPDIKTRALLLGKSEAGTVWGEFVRNALLFKMFTASIMTKVLPRVWESADSLPGRLGMMGAFALMSTIAGGFSYQLKEIAKGRNPREIASPQFWLAAAAQGGGLGIYGDYLFGDVNRFGQGMAASLVGPVGGLTEDALKLTIGNMQQALKGEKTNIGAETIQFIKGNIPVMNLWYTRAALDHALFYQVQEAVNPGYLNRMRNTERTRMGQTRWWDVNEALPSKLPEVKLTK